MGYELNRAFAETDLSEVYAAVRVPTLVLYRILPASADAEESRAVAAVIPQARAMRVSGSDYWGVFLSPEIVDELERLAAGEAAPAIPESVLTTLLFTDIVGSSRLATEVGDRAWRDLLARHHATVRRELAHFRGQERDTAGDGFFATFDGPARAIRCAQAASMRSGRSGSRFEPGSTPASASSTKRKSQASRCRSAPASVPRRKQTRCSFHGPSRILLPAPASNSSSAATMNLKASGTGNFTPSSDSQRAYDHPNPSGTFANTRAVK